MKTIVVTGACGYIGKHVVDALLNRGARVVALDLNEGAKKPGITWVTGNLLDAEFDASVLEEFKPDACLHLAWRNGFNHNAETHMLDLSGHYRFLCKMVGLDIKQIAVMGSMHEVGYWEGPISEETPCNPVSLYGIAKDALRRAFFARVKNEEIIAQWLRGYYIYGDDIASQSIFGKILRADAEGRKTFPFTSGKNKYDFIKVSELGDQIASCLLQDSVQGIINCCSGSPLSLGEAVEGFIAENGLNIKLEYGKFPDRPYDSPGVWGDASKINQIMGA